MVSDETGNEVNRRLRERFHPEQIIIFGSHGKNPLRKNRMGGLIVEDSDG